MNTKLFIYHEMIGRTWAHSSVYALIQVVWQIILQSKIGLILCSLNDVTFTKEQIQIASNSHMHPGLYNHDIGTCRHLWPRIEDMTPDADILRYH